MRRDDQIEGAKMRKVSAFVVVGATLAVIGCGGGDDAEPAATVTPTVTSPAVSTEAPDPEVEEVELKFLALVTPTLTREFWETQVGAFEAANSNVTVQIIAGPDADQQAYLRQLIAAGDLPDVGFAIAASEATAPFLAEWDPSDPDLQSLKYVETLTLDEKLYALGVDIQPRNTIFYNMDLMAEAGIADLPSTWGELESTLETLKAADVSPICGAGEWVTGRMLMGFSNIFTESPDWYAQRATNDVQFNGPDWREAADRFADWGDKGYFTDGALGTPYVQVEQDFLAGRCALYQMGVWFTGTDKASPASFPIAVGPAPTADGSIALTGGIGTANFVVFEDSSHPAEARELAKYLAFDVGAHQAIVETNGTFSSLGIASSINWDFTPLQLATQGLLESADSFNIDYIGQGDFSPADGIVDAVNVMAQALLTGADAESELQKLDDLWDRNTAE